jgi:hypothetical protein
MELLGLLERGTFKVVLREEIPKNAPVMKGRFVLVINNRDTDQEVYKARLCRTWVSGSTHLCIIHRT